MQAEPAGRPTAGGVLAAAVGLVLLVYFVRRAGAGAVADGIARLGWAFLAVVALGGARFLVRAAAWMRCMDGSHHLRLRDTFRAVIAGDAVGNLTPLSLIAGEPAKALMLRHREPVGRTLPALVVENLFYTLSAAIVVTGGLVVLPLMLQPPGPRWLAGAVLLTTLAALVAAAHWVVRGRIRTASRALDWLRRRGVAPAWTARAAVRLRGVEDDLHAAYPHEWSRLLPVAALELTFHVLAITEIFLVLSLISGRAPTLLEAFLFESTNRVIGAAFKFVPLRIGVDEAGTGLLAGLLAFGTATGVTLALIRKGRMLVWTTLGVAALVGRGLSLGNVLAWRGMRGAGAAVVVMARSPLGGRPPKTRLADAVGREADRRRLYAAFLRDTIDGCRSVAGAALRVAYTPDGGAAGLDALGVRGDELLSQRGADLGARERAVFADLFAAGFQKVVMVGSDLPTLPAGHICQALEQVSPGTTVLGPSDDGGYYLIALAATETGTPIPDLFSGIRWSTASALDDTRAAAGKAGLRVVLVPALARRGRRRGARPVAGRARSRAGPRTCAADRARAGRTLPFTPWGCAPNPRQALAGTASSSRGCAPNPRQALAGTASSPRGCAPNPRQALAGTPLPRAALAG